MNTPSKNSSKLFGSFEHFLSCILRKIIMNISSKIFFEAVRLVLKIFSGADFEKSHEYTLEKFFETVWIFKKFSKMQNSKTFMNTPSKFVFSLMSFCSFIFCWGVYYKDNLEYKFNKIYLKPFGYF